MTRALLHNAAAFALALVAIAAPAAAQTDAESPPPAAAEPATAAPPAEDWIRPEDIADRADSLAHRLESRTATGAVEATIEKIEAALTQLDPEFDAAFLHAKSVVSSPSSLITIQDARRQLQETMSPLPGWKAQLEKEARRVADVLDEAEAARLRWLRTLARPETVQAGEVVVRRVETSLAQIHHAADTLKALRVRMLALSDRLVDRSGAITGAIESLEAATRAEGASLLAPDHAPIWRRGLAGHLARELPLVAPEMAKFQSSTTEYVLLDARPFAMQLLLGLVLMFALRGLPEGSRSRITVSQVSPETLRLLQRPYAIALLLALTTSPAMHPTAPHRVMQLLGLLALIPVARILMLANERRNTFLYIGLFALLVLDRTALGLASLPAISVFLFLVQIAIAQGVAFEYRRRLRASGGNSWLVGALTVAMWGLGLVILAEIGGWSSLATTVGRGILVSGTAALYVYAVTISMEALSAYALASPILRSSRFVDRNQEMVQRWTSIGLRVVGTILWLRLLVGSLGLRDIVSEGADALLAAGVSVGALSISVGGVLAFVSTLVFAMFLSRFVHEVLEDEIFPRTNLPRGIPHALMTLTRYAIWTFGFLLALAAAGVQISQLSILLGGLGVGVGLGLQDVVKNFAAGITLLLERRVHVGDAVEIPDKNVFGRVLAIGMRASVVRNWNGTEVVMPNDDLVSASVTNWTLSDRIHRMEVAVGVAYGTDPELVIALLLRVAGANEHVLASPAPTALFTSFGDSSLNFVLRAWNDEEYERNSVRTSELAVEVHRALKEAGISVPFPQRDLHLASVSEQAGAALRPAAAVE